MPTWCDMMCPHAEWPQEEALDGSGSCRTFIAVQCTKYNQITAKNGPCLDLRQLSPSKSRAQTSKRSAKK
ncbi:MAG: hypothetical protein RBU29_16325 [bacterium]|jgi:hypothetical protein|nr:hypothetical protein [bacterium]